MFKDVLGRMEMDIICFFWGGGTTFDEKIEAFSGVQVSPTAECSKHRAWCWVPAADVDASGSPCQLWSSVTKGAREGRHRFAHLIVAWGALMRSDRPPISIHENVVGLCIGSLRRLPGDTTILRS